MRSRLSWLALVGLVATACRVEHGEPPAGERGPRGPGYSFDTARDTTPVLASEHAVFDRRREAVAPGVVRLTVEAIVGTDRGREPARAAMLKIVDDERRRDSTLAAIRVLAYLEPAPGSERRTQLRPLGYLDWVPPAGWDYLTPETRAGFHRTNLVWLVNLPEAPPRAP